MDFDPSWLLISLPVAFVLGWLASRFDIRQLKLENRQAPKAYFRGLNFLLNEQQDQAIDAFIEAVQNDPDTQELHFALGNLFRRRGEYQRAVRVHEHLLGRGDLSRSDRERAQHALAQDFLRAGLLDRAEAALQKLEGTRYENEARLSLLAIYERSREWAQAADVAQKLDESDQASYSTRRAHHLCEQATEQVASGDLAGAAKLLAAGGRAGAAGTAPGHRHRQPAVAQRRGGRRLRHAGGPERHRTARAAAVCRRAAAGRRGRAPRGRRARAAAAALCGIAVDRRARGHDRARRHAERHGRIAANPRRATATSRTSRNSPRWSRPRAGWPARSSSTSSSIRRCSARSTRPRARSCATAARPAASRRTSTSGTAPAARPGTATRRAASKNSEIT
jgi:tetratricopeptide (TPR) repeat protein